MNKGKKNCIKLIEYCPIVLLYDYCSSNNHIFLSYKLSDIITIFKTIFQNGTENTDQLRAVFFLITSLPSSEAVWMKWGILILRHLLHLAIKKSLINQTGFGQATKPYCLQYSQYPSSINICRKFRHINASAPLNEQSAYDNPPSYGESPMHIISLIQQKLRR